MFRLIAQALVGLSLLAPAMTAAQSTTTPTELGEPDRDKLRAEIRAYLLDNPEVILEALEILEQRRELQAQAADKSLIATYANQIFDDGHSFVAGNPNGDITLVEFLDYRCHYCKQAHPQIAELLKSDPNIKLVVKEFPILGPNSVAAGRIAIAAAAIDDTKYKALNDALMTFKGNLTERAAYRVAEGVGYDTDTLRAEADSDATTEKLNANFQLAQVMGLNGTPSFILEDEVIRGFLPAAQMQALIDEKRRANANSN
ncbi:MAG: DsbA family protein [Pseudomonadota bacterium]